MYTQYQNNGNYRNPSQTALNNKIPLYQDYVQFATGQYSYVLIVGDYNNGRFEDATIYEISTNDYDFNVIRNTTAEIRVTNEYYTYSNVLDGQSYYNQAQINDSYSLSLISFTLAFALPLFAIFSLIRRKFRR